jgi:hypothetical protein
LGRAIGRVTGIGHVSIARLAEPSNYGVFRALPR